VLLVSSVTTKQLDSREQQRDRAGETAHGITHLVSGCRFFFVWSCCRRRRRIQTVRVGALQPQPGSANCLCSTHPRCNARSNLRTHATVSHPPAMLFVWHNHQPPLRICVRFTPARTREDTPAHGIYIYIYIIYIYVCVLVYTGIYAADAGETHSGVAVSPAHSPMYTTASPRKQRRLSNAMADCGGG
jgi:hypothetical protein